MSSSCDEDDMLMFEMDEAPQRRETVPFLLSSQGGCEDMHARESASADMFFGETPSSAQCVLPSLPCATSGIAFTGGVTASQEREMIDVSIQLDEVCPWFAVHFKQAEFATAAEEMAGFALVCAFDVDTICKAIFNDDATARSMLARAADLLYKCETPVLGAFVQHGKAAELKLHMNALQTMAARRLPRFDVSSGHLYPDSYGNSLFLPTAITSTSPSSATPVYDDYTSPFDCDMRFSLPQSTFTPAMDASSAPHTIQSLLDIVGSLQLRVGMMESQLTGNPPNDYNLPPTPVRSVSSFGEDSTAYMNKTQESASESHCRRGNFVVANSVTKAAPRYAEMQSRLALITFEKITFALAPVSYDPAREMLPQSTPKTKKLDSDRRACVDRLMGHACVIERQQSFAVQQGVVMPSYDDATKGISPQVRAACEDLLSFCDKVRQVASDYRPKLATFAVFVADVPLYMMGNNPISAGAPTPEISIDVYCGRMSAHNFGVRPTAAGIAVWCAVRHAMRRFKGQHDYRSDKNSVQRDANRDTPVAFRAARDTTRRSDATDTDACTSSNDEDDSMSSVSGRSVRSRKSFGIRSVGTPLPRTPDQGARTSYGRLLKQAPRPCDLDYAM